MVQAFSGARGRRADIRVRARLHVRPRRLGPGFRDRSGVLRSRLRARRSAAAVRDLGYFSGERPFAARLRTGRRALRRPNGRGRSHVGSLAVAARDRTGPVKKNIKLLYGFSFFDQFMIVIAVWVSYLATPGIGMRQFMELQAVFALVILCGEVPSGLLSGLWGRKKTRDSQRMVRARTGARGSRADIRM